VIITHGRARRRMIGYGVEVAATMARTRVPELIAEAFAAEASKSKAADPQAEPGGSAADAGPAADPEPLESAL
jgi:hypothetical protein